MSKHKSITPIDEVWKRLSPDRAFYRTWAETRDTLHRSFSNSTPLFEVGSKPFSIPDAVAAAIVSRAGAYFIGARGSGKSLMTDAIRLSVFNDNSLFMTGDPNLVVKALYEKLDLTGKTTEEVYQLAKSIGFPLVCVDELTNMPGIVQRSLLGIADGYIEVRGKKIPLGGSVPMTETVAGEKITQGSKYVLFVANGNPVLNGDYSVFLEDLALLDRISLIIDFDRVPPADGNLARIGELAMDKEDIRRRDLSGLIIPAYGHLKYSLCPEVDSAVENAKKDGLGGQDLVIGVGQAFMEVAMRSMLMEAVYSMFRYVDATYKVKNHGAETQVPFACDKVNTRNWREMLMEKGVDPLDPSSSSGSHSSGTSMAFCSEISPRTLANIGRLALAIFKIAKTENELKCARDSRTPLLHPTTLFIDSYLSALKMALTYDRRFIPPEFAEDRGTSQKNVLDNAFSELRARLIPQTRISSGSFAVDVESLDTVTTLYSSFLAARALKDDSMAEQLYSAARSSLPTSTVLNKVLLKIMEARMKETMTSRDNEDLLRYCES